MLNRMIFANLSVRVPPSIWGEQSRRQEDELVGACEPG